MALASTSATDPVKTIVDLLTDNSWPNKKPSNIEKRWNTTFDKKLNRGNLSAYVHSFQNQQQDSLSVDGDHKDEEEFIRVELWSPTESEANNAQSDTKAILEDYWNDRTANTNFHRIRPEGTDDRRAETSPQGGKKQYVQAVDVRLRTENSMGT